MPTVSDAIRAETVRLAAAGFDTPRLDAEILLRHVLQVDRSRLFTLLRDAISVDHLAALSGLVDRRLTGISVAYLTGHREFMGHDFQVGPGVLVPRPETEWLVEWAASRLSEREAANVVDVGTGSGAIIISLALEFPGSLHRFTGCDISSAALRYARSNALALDVDQRVAFVRGDLLEWADSRFDLILANLPYLRPDQVHGNRELTDEPEIALVSGADGLAAIRRLLADVPRVLAPGGAIALECDPSQTAVVAELIENVFSVTEVTIVPDLSGLNRMVIGSMT